MAKLPPSTAGNTATAEHPKKEFKLMPNNAILDVVVEKCELRELKEEFRKKFNITDTHEINFSFRVQNGEFEKRMLWGSAKPYINDSDTCRLRIWAQEILGVDKLPDGFEFDTEDMEGLSCRILVKQHTKNDGNITNKVSEVLRSVNQSNGFQHSTEEEPF